jgi:hypothetical protein
MWYGVLFDAEGINVDQDATNVLRARMRALGLPRDTEAPSFEAGPATAIGSNFPTWSGEATNTDDKRRIVISPDDADENREEIEKWESEIRWAGLLRVRCCCC